MPMTRLHHVGWLVQDVEAANDSSEAQGHPTHPQYASPSPPPALMDCEDIAAASVEPESTTTPPAASTAAAGLHLAALPCCTSVPMTRREWPCCRLGWLFQRSQSFRCCVHLA